MSPRETILAYFNCYKERDKEGLRALLTPDFVHSSPFGRFEDRDLMIETIWPAVGPIWAENIEIFGGHPEFMVRYSHAGEASGRLAEWFRFEGEQIAEIEVYLGAGAAPAAQS